MNSISVIMTVCNAENIIAEAIESVLKQSFTGFEIIIVNSGSTDNTHSLISSYDDERISIINNNGQDLVQSLNSGIKASTGKYIALHDANSIMHIDRLKLQYSVMEEYPEITVCSSWETVFGQTIPKRILEQKICGRVELPLVQLLLDDLTISSSYTVRRSFITENHLIYENNDHIKDYKFWVETAKLNGGFYIDSQPLVYRRIREAGNLKEYRAEQSQFLLKIKKDIVETLCEKYIDKYPALTNLYNSYYDLFEQKLISENEIFHLFHSLFIKNKEVFQSL